MPKLNPKALRERMKQLLDIGDKVYNRMKRYKDLKNVIEDNKVEQSQETSDVQLLDGND
jgi:hypothetical protein